MTLQEQINQLIDERIAIALSNIEEKPHKAVLNARETAEYIGYSREWVVKNKDALPPRLSDNPIRYLVADLDEWLQEQRQSKITTTKKVGVVTVRPVKKGK